MVGIYLNLHIDLKAHEALRYIMKNKNDDVQ
jgi:hypothetical protein